MNWLLTAPSENAVRPIPFWMIWANPIFRRYCRSRLRPKGLGFSLLLTLIFGGFLFFLTRGVAIHQGGMEPVDAERLSILFLVPLQWIIIFLLGTGQVAAGMTAEADEGVIDYQRLAPMTPLAKVFGYLFGLPVREWVCFLSLLPFIAWSAWKGNVNPGSFLTLYGVIFISAILYHLTGLVAGTVLKNRRWAFLVSMGLVFALYTVMPAISRFGLSYFHYFTVEPVVVELLPDFLPREAAAAWRTGQNLIGHSRFFNLNFPEAVFTIVSQGFLILTLIIMLWRRWRRAESHLLGKAWAAGFFGWIQLVLIGNAVPLIEPGLLFPSREFLRRYGFMPGRMHDWQPDPWEAVGMAGAFGLVSLLLLWLFTSMITPNADTQTRGWRRSRKLRRKSLPFASDPSSAFGWVALMAVFGTVGWFFFSKAIVESRWFPGAEMPVTALLAFAAVFSTGSLGFHALLESRGPRIAALAAILAGLVPILVGIVLGSIRFQVAAIWVAALSPASGPVYAAGTTLPVSELPMQLARAVPRAFWFWQGVAFLVMLNLVAGLFRTRKGVRDSVVNERGEPSEVPKPDAS